MTVGVGEDVADILPRNVKLFGDHHRHGGKGALPHLGLRGHDADDVVGVDREPGVDLDGRAMRAGFGRARPSIRPPAAEAVTLRKARLLKFILVMTFPPIRPC